MKEFSRVIGLAANGVGIGSFVYLRRIFEELIINANSVAIKKVIGWDQDSFKKLRMDDKIKSLKTYLPAFLVENSQMYGLLSLAIHSLNEDECLEHFDVIKAGIEIILDEKVIAYDKQKKS